MILPGKRSTLLSLSLWKEYSSECMLVGTLKLPTERMAHAGCLLDSQLSVEVQKSLRVSCLLAEA